MPLLSTKGVGQMQTLEDNEVTRKVTIMFTDEETGEVLLALPGGEADQDAIRELTKARMEGPYEWKKLWADQTLEVIGFCAAVMPLDEWIEWKAKEE